jgi:hypothetical protein
MYIVKEREVNSMKKIIIWLFIKSINPHLKVVFTDEESSFEWSTDTIYLNLNENCHGFMRHLRTGHHVNDYWRFNKIIWQVLHEIGHYYTLDFIEEDDDEIFERAVCSLIDKDTAENNIKIQNIYFNLEKEWEATEWAIRYAKQHFTKCKFFNKFLKNT